MHQDKFGRTILDEQTILELLYSGKITNINSIYLRDDITDQFNNAVDTNRDNFDKLSRYIDLEISIEDFDKQNQSVWFMPNEYKTMDIESWILDQCFQDVEIRRVQQELELFNRFNMIDLLRFLKYLVDYMRSNKILWGLGRGSSVASYCLYLIGVHKVDSIKYDLDIKEFLK